MQNFLKKAKYIFEYVVYVILISLLKLFSIDRAANICSFIARKIGPHLSFSKIARKNLERVYGNSIDMDKTIDDLWDNYGRYIGEFPFINTMKQEELDQRIKITGLENIEKFQKEGKPFMLFLGHQANWDFVIRKINEIYPEFAIVYRKANNPYVNQKILDERADKNTMMIAKGPSGAKDLVRAIKKKMSIAMLVDQKMNDGIEVPFFGMPAMTAPAIARLALQYDYPIVPAQLVRKGSSSYFEVKIHKPFRVQKTDNIQKDCYDIMLKINKILEGWIRENPGQWFWFHNRWK